MSIDSRHFSYLDYGGHGQPLLALHGHFGEARTFTGLARELAPDWRVIALDQRGHGRSERPADFSRDGYIGDAAALLDHLDPSTGASASIANATSAKARWLENAERRRSPTTWQPGRSADCHLPDALRQDTAVNCPCASTSYTIAGIGGWTAAAPQRITSVWTARG
ncbi:alpha/beta fold hydrolase [Streptomyces sp. HC307]|uniref:alpha/beta fold hydrolase n=1 Tax=Streptomyces flavusporus TaxID=3385496 RepID=UPI003916E40D